MLNNDNCQLRVGIFVDKPRTNSGRFERCCKEWNFSFIDVAPEKLDELDGIGVDVLLLPGGWYGIDRVPGQEQYDNVQTTPVLKRRGDAMRAWVRTGGGVVGICAGAHNVVWLGLVEADLSRMQGAGPHSMEVRAEKHPICNEVIESVTGHKERIWKAVPVIRCSGPMIFPKGNSEMIFSYDWEGRLGAIVASSYGKGRAVACSPHPERTEHDIGEKPVDEPLMPVAGLLKNALLWSARRI